MQSWTEDHFTIFGAKLCYDCERLSMMCRRLLNSLINSTNQVVMRYLSHIELQKQPPANDMESLQGHHWPFPIPLMTPPVTTIYFFSFRATTVVVSASCIHDAMFLEVHDTLFRYPAANLTNMTRNSAFMELFIMSKYSRLILEREKFSERRRMINLQNTQ